MNFITKHLWPWTRFAALEARNAELESSLEALADSTNAIVVRGSSTMLRDSVFDHQKVYVSGSAKHAVISGCIFRDTNHESCRAWQALRDFLDGTAEQWQQAVNDAYNEGLEDADLRRWD